MQTKFILYNKACNNNKIPYKKYNIQRTIGISPVHANLACISKKILSFSFSDTEHSKEQIALWWPFSKIYFHAQCV